MSASWQAGAIGAVVLALLGVALTVLGVPWGNFVAGTGFLLLAVAGIGMHRTIEFNKANHLLCEEDIELAKLELRLRKEMRVDGGVGEWICF